ncbi:MAG: Tyrosine recombinase XerD [Mycoplasmataceae bacterium]|nr:MAG: Tyrosine recombinase XerD [Mycoplasmataceae bacterium]
MKNCNFQQNPLWENNQINNYKIWLKRKNFTDETISRYLITINKFREKDLTTDSVISFLRDGLKKYQPNTLRGQKNAIASCAKFLQIYQEIEWDIITKIIPRIQKRPFPIITQEEFEKLLTINTKTDKLTRERNNLVAQFFWYIGMRVSELINIRHSDYRSGLLKLHGKGNKIREVIVPEFLVPYFNPCSKDYLFLTRHGKRLTKGQILRNIKKRAKLAGITKNISLHTFRRSFATNSHNKGMRLDTIQKQLGHSNVNTTLEYIHNDYQSLYADYSKLWSNQKILSQ